MWPGPIAENSSILASWSSLRYDMMWLFSEEAAKNIAEFQDPTGRCPTGWKSVPAPDLDIREIMRRDGAQMLLKYCKTSLDFGVGPAFPKIDPLS